MFRALMDINAVGVNAFTSSVNITKGLLFTWEDFYNYPIVQT